jgi:2-phospho-L-lactate guanylyltransferase
MHSTVAIVPLKALAGAKARLAPELDGAARRELVAWMLQRVVAACLATGEIGDVLAVVGDAEGAALAQAAGATVLREDAPGLRRALALADAHLAGHGSTLVVAADLPLVQPEDLAAVLAAAPSGPCVVVAPTADGGTGALLRRPPGIIAPAYGPGSADAHLSLARAAGIAAVRVDVPRLSLDVDTPSQLAALADRFPPGTTGA